MVQSFLKDLNYKIDHETESLANKADLSEAIFDLNAKLSDFNTGFTKDLINFEK